MKHKLKHIFMRLTDAVILLAIVSLIIYSLILNSSPKVSVSNTVYGNIDKYQAKIARGMKPFGQHNKITFDKTRVLQALQASFPEVASVNIDLPLISHKASVNVVVSPPAFRLASNQSVYIVDSDGVVVAEASTYPTLSNLPLITDQSGFQATVGKTVFDTNSINFVNQLLVQLKHYKISIAKMILPPRAEELDLTASDHSYFVKFYLAGDPLTQIGRYLAARSYFHSHHIQPSQYLDVRVSGKLFYK